MLKSRRGFLNAPYAKKIEGTLAVQRNFQNAALQPLTAMKSKYNEPSEGDNGSGAGLVSRARIPLS